MTTFSEADTWVIGLKKSNLNAFIGKVALRLSKVQRSMIRRGVPAEVSHVTATKQVRR